MIKLRPVLTTVQWTPSDYVIAYVGNWCLQQRGDGPYTAAGMVRHYPYETNPHQNVHPDIARGDLEGQLEHSCPRENYDIRILNPI